MKAEMLIVGTAHMYQLGARLEVTTPATEIEKFWRYLIQICKSQMVDTLAEEANTESLRKAGRPLLKEIATHLTLNHVYCDPTHNEKKELGIVDRASFMGSDSDENLSAVVIELMCERSHRQRELFWLQKLEQEIIGKRVLFVCGARHVASFSSLLLFSGLQVQILEFDWAP